MRAPLSLRRLCAAVLCLGLAWFGNCLAELGLVPGQEADNEISSLSMYYIILNDIRSSSADCIVGDLSFNHIGGTGSLTCSGNAITASGKVGLISVLNSGNVLSLGLTANMASNGTVELIGGARNSDASIDFGHGLRLTPSGSTARGLNSSGNQAAPKTLPANPTADADFTLCIDIELNENPPQIKGNIPGSCNSPDTVTNYFDSQAVVAMSNDENDAGGRRAWGLVLSDARVSSLSLNETQKYAD